MLEPSWSYSIKLGFCLHLTLPLESCFFETNNEKISLRRLLRFLVIGLKNQLSKIDTSSLNTTHFARNLGYIFDGMFCCSEHLSAVQLTRRTSYGYARTVPGFVPGRRTTSSRLLLCIPLRQFSDAVSVDQDFREFRHSAGWTHLCRRDPRVLASSHRSWSPSMARE